MTNFILSKAQRFAFKQLPYTEQASVNAMAQERWEQLPLYKQLGNSVPDGGDAIAYLHYFGPGQVDFYIFAKHSNKGDTKHDLKAIGSWGAGEWEEAWWYIDDEGFRQHFADAPLELDFYFTPTPLKSIKHPLNRYYSEEEQEKPNPMLHDNWFKQYPEKVKGTATLKKRGDRGADAYEEIIEGSLVDALTFAYPPITEEASIGANSTNKEKERLRLLDLAMKLELDLMGVNS